MRYRYKIETSWPMILCYIAAAGLFAVGTFAGAPELFTTEWLLSELKIIAACLFIIWCGRIEGRSVRNFRKWRRYLIERGRRTDGRVTEIIRDNWITSGGSDNYGYQFRVIYVSGVDGSEKELVTPVLNFTPADTVQYVCSVYEAESVPDWAVGEDATSGELIKISGNRISFNLNPVKLLRADFGGCNQNWFGNAVADDFKSI